VNKFLRIFAAISLAVAAFLVLEKPAWANAPILWGAYATGQTQLMFGATRGILLAVVIVIESIVFVRVAGLNYWRAFLAALALNIFSAAAGFLAGAVMFSSSCGLPMIIIFPVLAIIYLTKQKAPPWLSISAIAPLFIAGAIFLILNTFIGNQFPIGQWTALYIPLFIGFAMTIFLEALPAYRFIPQTNRWRGILLANIASYIFLAVMVPFYAPNPNQYAEFGNPFPFSRYVESKDKMPQILDIIHKRRASNLELLGFGKQSAPPENYDAHFELELLKDAYLKPVPTAQPLVGMAVVDDALSVPTLTPNARKELEWFRKQITYWTAARDAILNNDQVAFNGFYAEWRNWSKETNPYRDYSKWSKLLNPEEACKEYIGIHKSSVRLPK